MGDGTTPADVIVGKLSELEQQIGRSADMTALIRRDIASDSAALHSPGKTLGPSSSAPDDMASDERQRFKAELGERFREIATLTLLVGEAEMANSERTAENDWLRRITLLVLKQPKWWRYMPTAWTNRRIRRRFAAHGLFDGDAYLHRYPDVAAEGIDPLLHYMLHGLREGRLR